MRARPLTRRLALSVTLVGLVLAVIAGSAVWIGWRDYLFDVEKYQIPGGMPPEPAATSSRTVEAPPDSPPYATSIDQTGRYFDDQYGRPFLIRGDSPWAMLSQLTPEESDQYWESRSTMGFNSAHLLLLGSREGSGSWNGATVDGIRPFLGGLGVFSGDITRPNPKYLTRAHDIIASAGRAGITAFVYVADTWSMGRTFRPSTLGDCLQYGSDVAKAMADLPNIVWVVGGDFTMHQHPNSVDQCFDAVRIGLRSAGDLRPLSIQFTSPLTWSAQSQYWRTRVDWNFLYSYAPPFEGAREAHGQANPIPVILGESNYEGLNLEPGTPTTTTESVRRQTAWALTSGAAGDFYGTADWEFPAGWATHAWPGAVQVNVIRDVIQRLNWPRLSPVPATHVFSTAANPASSSDIDRDVLDDNTPTAATTPNDEAAIVYLPQGTAVRLSEPFNEIEYDRQWVDPTNGSRTPATPNGDEELDPPNHNAGGDDDWLLVVTRE